VEDNSDDENESGPPKKAIRLLDYACGTGLVSRVRTKLSPSLLITDKEYRLLRHT
jgi:hypothetical protein